MRVNIFIKEQDLIRIDKYCIEAGFKRSNLLVSSTLQRIQNGQSVYKIEANGQELPPQSSKIEMCKHGRMLGLCEKGCK